jgi:cytochrome c553
MKKVMALCVSGLLMASVSSVQAGDVAAGKARAAACAGCHGANGISNSPIWPNLAGQKAMYVTNQLKAFKSGKRKDPIMGGQAAALSDADMANLGAYYASLK